MEAILQPPQPFIFENNIVNVTSENLSKEWDRWKQSFKIYHEACELGKKDAKVQINILLHIIGEKCRDVYDQFTEKGNTVDKVLERFDAFFFPKKNLTIERHRFFTRDQSGHESVEQYVFDLNKMAMKCEFKDLCQDLVRDRLICGIKDEALRERLLREPDLTLAKAIGICNLAELSRAQALSLKMTHAVIKPDESHILAIKNLPKPENKKDVERFLGLVTYVGRFVPNLSEKTFYLRELLKKSVEWHWDYHHQECFESIKKYLTNPPVLQYYSLEKPVVISVDASKHGLGCCLLQDDLPVSYASKSLSKAEQSYAQIEKELFACVYACERFYSYIYGRCDVTIETDHKPLISIVNKPLSNAPARLQRMLLRLQPYTFKLVFKPGKYLYIADALSRAVAPGTSEKSVPRDYLEVQAQVCALTTANPLTDSHFLEIQKCTKQDEELQQLMKIIKSGWPMHKSEISCVLKPYWDVRDELTLAFGIIWKGNRVVIPSCMRPEMLRKIHVGHLGIEKCKLRAREIMYWPNINSQLLDYLSRCQACLTYRKQNSKEPLIQHEVPPRAWCKIGADIFHYRGKSFLLLIDYYSKFIEMAKLKCLQSEYVINKMKELFKRHGIPEIVVSDNGPEFASNSFKQFAIDWTFKHVTSSPGYPQSNGQVERFVQVVKNIMRKTNYNNNDINLALLEYANTPISASIPSPAELLFNRKLRSVVPCAPSLLMPKIHRNKNVIKHLKTRQYKQKLYYNKGAKQLLQLNVGQKVKVRHCDKWAAGTITKTLPFRSYIVKLQSGTTLRRNRRHLIVDSQHRPDLELQSANYDDLILDNYKSQLIGVPVHYRNASSTASNIPINNTFITTRSGRVVRPPDRWGYPATAR